MLIVKEVVMDNDYLIVCGIIIGVLIVCFSIYLCKRHSKLMWSGGDIHRPVMVKYYLETCGHCKQFEPIWKKLKKQYSDKFDFQEIECKKNLEIAARDKIKHVPTIRFMYQGNVADDHPDIVEYDGEHNERDLKKFMGMIYASAAGAGK